MLTSKDLQNLLPEFISYLSLSNSSRSTIKNYSSDLRRILEKLPAEKGLLTNDLSTAIESLKADFSESTVRRFSFSLKAFTNYLTSKGYSFEAPKVATVTVTEDNKISPIQSFSTYLTKQGAATSTQRYYSNSVNEFFYWFAPTEFNNRSITQRQVDKVSRNDVQRYISYLKFRQFPQATIDSKLYSLKEFFNVYKPDIIYETNPVSTQTLSKKQNSFWQKLKLKKPRWWHAYRGHPMSDYLNYAALAALTLFIGLGLFTQLIVPKPININNLRTEIQKGLVLAATPPRILSFQGRLTNASGTPITAATNVVFKIYTVRTGGAATWTSKTWSVTPDQNGIFSVCLGGQDTTDDCLIDGVADTVIPASLFSDNAALYLGVTIGADSEATPRQRIAASSYALNSDSLDGIDSASFLRSDTSDNFTSGTLTFDSGTTLTVADGSTTNLNSSTIAIGNASGDSVTVNGASTFNTDIDLTFAGTENLAMTSDLAGTVNVISLTATPSSSAGTTQGLFIQQANSANTNGLDVGIKVDNADADLAIGDGLNFANTGGGGYTNYINSANFIVTGAGAASGADLTLGLNDTSATISTQDTNEDLTIDPNGTGAIFFHGATYGITSGGALTVSSCSGCGGGGFSGEVDDTTNDSLTFTSDDASPPSGLRAVYAANTNDLNLNVKNGGVLNIQENDVTEFSFSDSTLDFNANTITDVGNITATGAITIASAGAGNDVIINGADILDVQDNTTFAGTVDIAGLTTLTGGLTANDASADIFLIGQSGATDDTVTIAGDISLTDDDWAISATGVGTNLTANDLSCTDCIGPTEISDLTLGTDTAGNYVSSATSLGGLVMSGTEGASLGFDTTTALSGNIALSADAAIFGQSGLIFEGSSADTIETFLAVTNPTGSDHTFTFPDVASGDVCISSVACTATAVASGLVTLQTAYTGGNTITTTSASDIAFTLAAGLGTATKFSLTNNHVSNTTDFYLNNANASGTNTNAILIDQTGAGALTNGIQITNSGGNITSGINLVDTGGGTFTTGITFSGTFTTAISIPTSTTTGISLSGASYTTGVNITSASLILTTGYYVGSGSANGQTVTTGFKYETAASEFGSSTGTDAFYALITCASCSTATNTLTNGLHIKSDGSRATLTNGILIETANSGAVTNGIKIDTTTTYALLLAKGAITNAIKAQDTTANATDGAGISLTAGNGGPNSAIAGDADGGSISLTAGNATSFAALSGNFGGSISLTAGTGSGFLNGGSINITSGEGNAFTSTGNITLSTTSAAGAVGGSISLTPGTSGPVKITSLVTTGTGTSSAINLTATSLTTGNALDFTLGNPKTNNNSGVLTSGNVLNLVSANHDYIKLDNRDLTVGGHKNQISISNIQNTFVYDTARDRDGGRWTADERAVSSSWYNETKDNIQSACVIGTDDRCGTSAFPDKAILVVAGSTGSNTLYIFDAKDNSLWMSFTQNATATAVALGVNANNTMSSVYALNGEIYVGASGSAATGAYIINFKTDKITRVNGTDSRDYASNIGNRNTTQTTNYPDQGRTTPKLVSVTVTDIFAQIIGGKTYMIASNGNATAANGGITVLNETNQTVANLGPANENYQSIFYTADDVIYGLSSTTAELDVWYNASSASGNNVAKSTFYDETTKPALHVVGTASGPTINTTTPDALFVTNGTSDADGQSNTIYIAHNNGTIAVEEKVGDETGGAVKDYTSNIITEEMFGDIRLALPMAGSGTLAANTTITAGSDGDASVKVTNMTTKGASGQPTHSSAVRGNGITFDGTDDYLCTGTTGSCSSSANIDFTTGNFSVSFWLKTSGSPTSKFIVDKRNAAAGAGYNIQIDASGKMQSNTAGAVGSIATSASTKTINDNLWHFITLTLNRPTNNSNCAAANTCTLQQYIDGIADGSGTSTTQTSLTNTGALYIACNSAATPTNCVNATIDEFTLTATVLNQGQIQFMANVGRRALNNPNHAGSTTIRGVSVSADTANKILGATAKAVFASLHNGQIYIGTTTGGVSIVGMYTDTVTDFYRATITAPDDIGTNYDSTNGSSVNSVSVQKGYGTGVILGIGINSAGSGGLWAESDNTTLKDFLGNSYNPFGDTLVQTNLISDRVFRVTNQLSTRLDNFTIAGSSQPQIADLFKVDNNGVTINSATESLYTNTAGTNTVTGLILSTINAITTNGAGGTTNFKGIDITTPNITQTAGTLSSIGLNITLGTITTGGTSTGLKIKGTSTAPTAGTFEKLIDIQDGAGNNLFELRDILAGNNNFGAAATTGAFISRNSYYGEEFNNFHTNNTTAATAQVRGDYGNPNTAANTAGAGELGAAITIAGTGACTSFSSVNTVNGVERITVSGGNSSAACMEYNSTGAAGTSLNLFSTTNLPVVTMKIQPSLHDSNHRFWAGIGTGGTAAATVLPTNGVGFTNCTDATPTCGATLQGQVKNGATITNVQCTASFTDAKWLYLRIEVRGTSDIHFFYDADTSDGITETECGSGNTGASNTTGVPMMIQYVNAANNSNTLDLDYLRVWQDDNVPVDQGVQVDNFQTTNAIPADTIMENNLIAQGMSAEQTLAEQRDKLNSQSPFIKLDENNNLTATLSASTKFVWKNTAGQIVAWVSDTGESFFSKVTATLGEFTRLVFGEAVVKKDSQTAGQASFASGEMEVNIPSDKVKEDSLINLTSISKTGGVHLYIKEIKEGVSFTVGLERDSGDQPNQATASATAAIRFNWLIVNQQ